MAIIIVYLQVLNSILKLRDAVTAESKRALLGNFLLSVLWGMFAVVNVVFICFSNALS